MNAPNAPLPPIAALPDGPDLPAMARACRAAPGHFDELRSVGVAAEVGTANASEATGSRSVNPPTNPVPDPAPDSVWHQFLDLSEAQTRAALDQRYANLQRQIRDNGVTYNVYADQEGPQRPWSLDLFPLLVDAASWQQIESGVLQRMQLLEALMADVYGPQTFLRDGLLPAALVQGNPGYLRPMHGTQAAGGRHLHVAAFDLARGPDGLWWLIGQRCQAPSGLGYLLENRLAVSRQFPQAFQSMRVQRLAATYRALVESLKNSSPAGAQAHIALLTPGPYNETYFEHAYLARYLGLTLVEGNDLIVRDAHLYLKTLQGLVPVHGLLKRVDDQYLDPLELRADSTLGVPGLLQAIRAGNVLVANTPGSAFLESPAILGFLPALARKVLQQELTLPALPTWWCGERSALDEVQPALARHTVKQTFAGSPIHQAFESVMGRELDAQALAQWGQRLRKESDDYTLQAYLPLSQMPTWQAGTRETAGRMAPKSVMLRVFAVADGHDVSGKPRWRVLPGGLARVAGNSMDIASMQRGGSSADVWALTDGDVDTTSLLTSGLTPHHPARRQRLVTSRAAANLYWLGRYTERTENTVRLARLTLDYLGGEDQRCVPLLQWLGSMAVGNTLVLPDVPSPVQARRVFERALIANLAGSDGATSVVYNLRALKMAAASVRERLSQEHWSVIVRAEEEFVAACSADNARTDYSSVSAVRALKTCSDYLAAITGAQTDRMTRDDGWRLLSIGRHIERLAFLAQSLERGLASGMLDTEAGFEAMLNLFDSTITYRAQYQQDRDLVLLVDLLVRDRDNPRSLAWVARTLRGRLAKLAGSPDGVLSPLSLKVPEPGDWDVLSANDAGDTLLQPLSLSELLRALGDAACNVSDEICSTYFTHSGQTKQSVGT